MDAERERVWMVTGGGRGIGRALIEAALQAGESVAATVRQPAVLDDLAADHPELLHVEVVDVRDRAGVHRAIDGAVARFGRLDVVVNNAGYGLVGAIEEVGEAEARAIVDTNMFGALWVTQGVLAHLRRQGSGHIIRISTSGAVGTMPTFGLYNASKWALEGFSEALAAEVQRFGVRVTIAELGGFSTAWAGASMQFAEPNPAYDGLRIDLFGLAEVPWPGVDEVTSTDDAPPSVAVAAIRAHVDAESGPLRLLVGDDVPGQVAAALAARRDDYCRDPRFEWPAPASGSPTG
jgi:NAD(P)-dependent dehydrogenase (short-subunit alcohol dehydrogenase family)